VLAIAVFAVWFLAFRVPGVRELVLGGLGAFGIAVGLVIAGVVLAALGYGLFAAVERVGRWLTEWPDDGPNADRGIRNAE
jgi:hypothetical protein